MSTLQKILSFVIFLLILGGVYWIYLGLRPVDRTPIAILPQSTQSGSVFWSVESIGKIERIRGKVSGSHIDGKTETRPGSEVVAGTTFVTGPISEMEIIWSDRSLLRIGENSSVYVTSKDTIRVDKWTVWSRTVRDTQKDTPFSIETTRLVAAIRGTAIEVEETEKTSNVRLIDSTVLSGASEVVLTGSGASEKFILNAGDGLEVGSGSTLGIKKFDIRTLIEKESDIAEYIKRDVVYLDTLLNTTWSDDTIRDRLGKEIVAALPDKEELPSFFLSEAIKTEAQNLFRTNTEEGVYTPEERRQKLIELIRNDRVLGELKETLSDKRESIVEEDQKWAHEQSINTLTIEIQEFDRTWKERFDAKSKEVSSIGTGSITEDPAIDKIEWDTPSEKIIPQVPVVPSISMVPKNPITPPKNPPTPSPAPSPKVSSSALPKPSTTTNTSTLPIPSLRISGSASPR